MHRIKHHRRQGNGALLSVDSSRSFFGTPAPQTSSGGDNSNVDSSTTAGAESAVSTPPPGSTGSDASSQTSPNGSSSSVVDTGNGQSSVPSTTTPSSSTQSIASSATTQQSSPLSTASSSDVAQSSGTSTDLSSQAQTSSTAPPPYSSSASFESISQTQTDTAQSSSSAPVSSESTQQQQSSSDTASATSAQETASSSDTQVADSATTTTNSDTTDTVPSASSDSSSSVADVSLTLSSNPPDLLSDTLSSFVAGSTSLAQVTQAGALPSPSAPSQAQDDGTPSHNSGMHTGGVVGVVIGVLFAVAALVVAARMIMSHLRHNRTRRFLARLSFGNFGPGPRRSSTPFSFVADRGVLNRSSNNKPEGFGNAEKLSVPTTEVLSAGHPRPLIPFEPRDATFSRASDTPFWLEQLGLQRPPRESSQLDTPFPRLSIVAPTDHSGSPQHTFRGFGSSAHQRLDSQDSGEHLHPLRIGARRSTNAVTRPSPLQSSLRNGNGLAGTTSLDSPVWSLDASDFPLPGAASPTSSQPRSAVPPYPGPPLTNKDLQQQSSAAGWLPTSAAADPATATTNVPSAVKGVMADAGPLSPVVSPVQGRFSTNNPYRNSAASSSANTLAYSQGGDYFRHSFNAPSEIGKNPFELDDEVGPALLAMDAAAFPLSATSASSHNGPHSPPPPHSPIAATAISQAGQTHSSLAYLVVPGNSVANGDGSGSGNHFYLGLTPTSIQPTSAKRYSSSSSIYSRDGVQVWPTMPAELSSRLPSGGTTPARKASLTIEDNQSVRHPTEEGSDRTYSMVLSDYAATGRAL